MPSQSAQLDVGVHQQGIVLYFNIQLALANNVQHLVEHNWRNSCGAAY